ncbi:unnamed protein product [Brassica napus]|uniref:Beta-galactosidase n=1 Tax=Brassica napus TaxID=3708 RepID=A0A816YXF4_BRANA|nr:unnamed protein product [Brassica napus]
MVSLRFLLFFLFVSSVYATIVSHDGRAITIDGHRRVLLSGSIHYPRSTPEMWPDLIKKSKEGGLDAIETYVFWNVHEPTRRQYDFSGKLDLIRFLKTIQNEGLYAVLRIGPYACAEWNYGGFPVWLHNMPGMVFRTTNKAYMDEMQNFTTMIVDMVKKEKLFASQGGPIILAQIENEYGNVMGPYGESGKAYIKWCANMAQSLDVGVPWIMCQQNDAPQPMLNTCNGFYCDNFVPNNPNTPKMWTENWTGWFKQWGGKNPHRTTEDELLIIIICSVYATIVSHDGRAITIDGHRRVLLSGSIHYPRSTPEMWRILKKKVKKEVLMRSKHMSSGMRMSLLRRQYDFSGKLDLIRFLKTIQNEGLYAVLVIGPYACAEWNYGGFPVWLHNMPGMVFRTTNKAYMDEMQNFTTMIVDMVKKEKLFASQGGPIILAQIENEYGNVMGPYGESGKAYIKWCANMAQSLDVGVPWIMCQQNDAPQPMLNTCIGFYCDNFVPNNPNTPKMWTENWTGWFKQWGGKILIEQPKMLHFLLQDSSKEEELLIIIICSVYATIVSHDGRAITIDGHRRVLLSGSIHYPRSTPEMWPDLIKKSKEGGLDAIETYVFWNAHEPTRRQYDFSGKLDLIRFLKTIQNEGLYAVLRIGPYACAEWNYGGFPVWLHNMPGMVFRTTNKAYMDEMQNFTTMIVDMVKKEKLFASQGGPIILAQIENEYGNVMGPYGESGKAYIKWCANMAQSLDVGVPWIMCQQNDAPQPMLNTCNGFYCDNFVPNNPNTPKMWTENWTGWFKQWGGKILIEQPKMLHFLLQDSSKEEELLIIIICTMEARTLTEPQVVHTSQLHMIMMLPF